MIPNEDPSIERKITQRDSISLWENYSDLRDISSTPSTSLPVGQRP